MQSSNNFYAGIDQDIDPKYQKEGTYRYALNAALETKEGDLFNISNEQGNIYDSIGFPAYKKIIGHTLTDNSDIVLFLYDPDERPEHEIGIYNPQEGTYTTIAKSGLLNFKNPINAIFRIKNACTRLIYFTDNTNPYRVADITDTSTWVNPLDKTITDINKIAFTRPYSIPSISTTQVKDGEGNLDYGSYLFYIRYLDEALNPTNRWVPLSNYIPIFYGSETLITTTNTHNADNNTASQYYASKANKSINLNIVNLDTSFKFYQIAVARKNSDTDIFTAVDILFPSDITTSSSTFRYVSNDDIFSTTSIDDILADDVRINTVKTHTIDNNRLFVANMSNAYTDYSLYQRLASKIRVQYRSTPSTIRSSKQSSSYTLPKSLLKNEVIALGIVYVKADGSETPVFHIPGRAANITQLSTHTNPFVNEYTNWDTDILTGDPNIVSGDRRWQIYNTASLAPTSTSLQAEGYLGYYQVSTNYPNITACDNASFWGQDYWGNNLANTPIRHHKIPPDWLFVTATNTAAHHHYDMQLQLDNIELPEDVTGYYIVYSDDENTVIDRGYLSVLKRDLNTPEASVDQTYYHDYIEYDKVNWSYASPVGNKKYYSFISPKTVYDSLGSNGNYISIEKILKLGPDRTRTVTNGNITVEEYGSDIGLATFINDYNLMVRPSERLNYNIVYNYYLNRSEVEAGVNAPDDFATQINSRSEINATNARIQNRSKNHNIVALELADFLSELTNPTSPGPDIPTYLNGVTFVASIKSTKDVYANLYNIKYKKFHNFLMTASPALINGGNSFSIFFDTVEHYWSDGTAGDANSFHSFVTGKFDHRYNAEARSYSNIDKKYTYYKHTKVNDHLGFRKYIVSKYYQLEAEVPLFFTENYTLNKRFNSIVAPNEYYPLAFNYDFCNLCLDDNPYRIYYSNIDSTETTTDLYRQIKPNNYKDIDGTFGPITDIFRAFNQVYLATTKTINLLPTKPQTLQTDIGNVYLGTGEVLALAPTRLTSPDFSMGGLQNFKSKVSTEYGVFYVDEESSRPMLLTSNINDLSKGLRNFWENNGTIKLVEQIKLLTGKFYLETNSIHGVGYMSTYDPRFKRIITHKRDYVIRPEYISTFVYGTNTTPSILWTDGYKFYYNDSTGEPSQVNLTNTTFFINKSFTLSYSFISNSWASYHSYFPSYMFNDHDTFYSSGINYTGVWKHNYGKYQTYFNTKDPHIVDLVALKNPIQAKALSSVIYTSKCTQYDPNTSQFQNTDETYTSLIAYNSYQTTGKVNTTIKNQFEASEYPLTYISKVDNNFRINNVRDMTISHNLPIWSNDPNLLAPYPYLDKYPNNDNINFAKSYFEMQRLRDHYLGLRFEFNSQYNTKISTDLVVTTYDEKTR